MEWSSDSLPESISVYGIGQLGLDVIEDQSGQNILKFGDQVSQEQLSFIMDPTSHNDLTVLVQGQEVAVLRDQLTNNTINQIEFSDGATMLVADIKNQISGTDQDDTLSGSPYNDYMSGGNGNDIYSHTVGDGQDIIKDTGGQNDVLELSGISFSDVSFVNVGDNLVIRDNVNNADLVTIEAFYTAGGGNKVELLRFDNDPDFALSELVVYDASPSHTDDVLNILSGETVAPLAGNDEIVFSGSNGIASITRGGGHDVITNSANANILQFDKHISMNELWFTQSGDDLLIKVLGEEQSVSIDDYFVAGSNGSLVGIQGLSGAIEITRSEVIVRATINGSSSYQPSGAENDISDSDMISYHSQHGAVSWSISSSYSEGGDIRFMDTTNNSVNAQSGDYIHGSAGNDYIIVYGSSGTPNYSYGDSGSDEILGSINVDYIYGGLGNDDLEGWNNDDVLYGGAGNDHLKGNNHNDWLSGGEGADILSGGFGADTFAFDRSSALDDIDTIQDFSTSEGDIIDISDVISAYDPVTDAITDFVWLVNNGSNTDLYVDVDGTGSNDLWMQVATLQGITGLTDEAALELSGTLKTEVI